jgi:hypothetical protein
VFPNRRIQPMCCGRLINPNSRALRHSHWKVRASYLAIYDDMGVGLDMYKKANRFMIGSRRSSLPPNRAQGRSTKATLRIARAEAKADAAIRAEMRKMLIRRQAEQYRALKIQHSDQVRTEAGRKLREAIIASYQDRKRTQLEAASKKAEISPQEISQRRSEESISSKRVVVMRRRNGQKAMLLLAIPIGHEAKPEVWHQR